MSIMAITRDTTLRRNTQIRYAVLSDQEAVMFNVAAGDCYALNSVAVRIWELLEQSMTVGQLCVQISEEFEIDLETCETAVFEFAAEVVDKGLVQALETQSSA